MSKDPMIGVRLPRRVIDMIDAEVEKMPDSGKQSGRSNWCRSLIYKYFDLKPEVKQKVTREKADEIRTLLADTDMRPIDLAERFDITPSYVSYIKNQKRFGPKSERGGNDGDDSDSDSGADGDDGDADGR